MNTLHIQAIDVTVPKIYESRDKRIILPVYFRSDISPIHICYPVRFDTAVLLYNDISIELYNPIISTIDPTKYNPKLFIAISSGIKING